MITTQPDGRRWLALAVLSLSMLITVVDTTIVNVALPTLAARLHASPSSLEWIVDAYTLSFAALLLPAGSTGDRIGRHRALAAGMAIFGAASLGAALSSAAPELTAWRAVMGAGAALVIPASLAIITGLFAAGPERARAIAVWSGVSGLGVAIGPTLGGWLLAHYAWGSIFAVNVPIAVLALIGGWFAVPASTALAPRRFDPGGTVLAAVSFGLLTYTIIEAGTAGWASGRTVGRWVASALLVAAFVAWEARAAQPMIEFDIFRDPRFAVASAAVAILFFGLAGVTFMLTQIYQFTLGYSPLAAGVRSLPSALADLGSGDAVRAGVAAAGPPRGGIGGEQHHAQPRLGSRRRRSGQPGRDLLFPGHGRGPRDPAPGRVPGQALDRRGHPGRQSPAGGTCGGGARGPPGGRGRVRAWREPGRPGYRRADGRRRHGDRAAASGG
jgi:MFS family permease